jgi:hypothetical protein
MEWEIQKRNSCCVGCDQIFIDGQSYHCLLGSDDEGWIRRDFCDSCWEKGQFEEKNTSSTISYWRGLIKPKIVEEKQEVLRKTTAEGLLRKYMHARGPAERNLCYILGLMLERKKTLIHKDIIRKDDSPNQFVIYEHAKTEEVFVIEDPGLSLDRLEYVQEQVKNMLLAEEQGEVAEENKPENQQSVELAESTVSS